MNENENLAFSHTTLSSSVDQFSPGQLLVEKYKIISRLGKGGMGSVYRVQQIFLQREYALKTIDGAVPSESALRRFQIEAQTASSLQHPNLIQVHDFGILPDGKPYLVMDLVNGITFADYLKSHGTLPIEKVTALFAQVCFGLLAAHEKGIVHRDIKPGNLMIVNSAPLEAEGSVKLVDFGIAKLTGHENGEIQALTRTGEIFGSPLYMSPEQCTGDAIDHRSDIYSLGCVLFEMLSGTPPFLGQNALGTMRMHESVQPPSLKEASMGKKFPASLEQIVSKMLSKAPSDRYQNVGLVAHDLALIGKDKSINLAQNSKNSPRVFGSHFSSPVLIISAISVVALVVGAWACAVGMGFGANKNQPLKTTGALERGGSQNDVATMGDTISKDDSLDQMLQERMHRDQAELSKVNRISSKLETKNGVLQKKFQFPECRIGLLHAGNPRNPSDISRVLSSARGTVFTPADVPLVLSVQSDLDSAVWETPSFFKKIDPKEFFGLKLAGIKSVLIKLDGGSDKTDNMSQILNVVSNWPNLHLITLQSPEPHAIVALSNIKTLKYLFLQDCSLDSFEASPLPMFGHLEELGLCRVTHTQAVAKTIAASDSLHVLYLAGSSVDPALITEIVKCKSLHNLVLNGKGCNSQAVTAIASMKNLHVLSIAGSRLTLEQCKALNDRSNLGAIELQSSIYSHSEQITLHRLNNKLKFSDIDDI